MPFQLARAAAEAGARPSFYRLIWAPNVMPTLAPRDPFKVLSRFGVELPSDQIDGDTAARFNEYVLQRLDNKAAKSAETLYVHCAIGDRPLAVDVSKALKAAGFSPLIRTRRHGRNP